MRGSKNRRILTIVVGVLVVAIVAFVAVGLLFESSWPGQLLQGAGVIGGGEPTIFPSESIVSSSIMPMQDPTGGGVTGAQVTFQGLWGGYCTVWGTDPDHPGGVKYNSGTFKMLVQGSEVQGYCIDLHHSIGVGDTYQANLHAGAEAGLCELQWIMANYHYNNPGLGLTSKEEGAAIQAALWYYIEGFQPVWNVNYWCGKQAVYHRTMEIINAAQGKCIPIPKSIELTADPARLPPGQTSNLTALVRDQKGNPFQGQAVSFASTPGSTLGALDGLTDAQGKVNNTLTYDGQGTHTATASMAGVAGITAVDAVNVAKQRILVIKPISYSGQASTEVTWESAPTAVFLNFFEAKIQISSVQGGLSSGGVLLRWETSSEINNLGFNVYRGDSAGGPWTRLNSQIIPSQVAPGSPTGSTYEFLDKRGNPRRSFYLLEDIDLNGTATQHGPIRPTR